MAIITKSPKIREKIMKIIKGEEGSPFKSVDDLGKMPDYRNPKDPIVTEKKKLKEDRKRKYPKCVPAAKAARMTDSQKRSAVARKRSKAQGVGGKPTNVKTFASKGAFTKYYYGGMIDY